MSNSRKIRATAIVVVACWVFWIGGGPTIAETTISGTVDDVRVEVTGATVEDLMSGLHSKFGLDYRSAVPLDQSIEGAYSGPVSRILRGVLRQYDYVLKYEEGIIYSVLVTDRRKSVAQPGAAQFSSRPPAVVDGGTGPLRQTPQTGSVISSYMQAQLSAFTNLPQGVRARSQSASAAPAPGTSQPDSATPAPAGGVSRETIANLTHTAQSTLLGLKEALARLSP